MRKISMLLFLVFSAFTTVAVAAEVKKMNVGQDGDKAVATYDLEGVEGERVADVTVAITIDGVRRTNKELKLTGDFGKRVKVGPGKKIIWNAMADLPSDFDGDLSWDIQAVSVSATSLPDEKKHVKIAKKAKKAKKTKKIVKKEDSSEESQLGNSITVNAKNGKVNFP
jgi:hypothetical protein